ncbi:hypothetical protein Elgi_14310 [Paenibacillus elgii]|uniref:S-layer homology domain-containing protein n=1 Tax=Paenibacillus elgii TaxID=189691 RepID=UPI002D7A6632|nr:hypothetical protein Elgi_14310 [Paenibacillus elgii]
MKRVVPLVVSMMLMSACSPNANTLVAAEQPKSAVESKAVVSLSDISGHWAESDIKAIVAAGYVDGYPDGSFKPDHTVTRAEFITMTAKAAGLKPVPGGDNKEWYAPYVAALVQAGIHQYKDFSSGDWNTPITRMEMARLAVRASDKSLQSPEDSTAAKKFMFLATQKGLITGMADGQLGKEESATRAQSVKIIQRILDVSQGKKLEVDKRAASYAEVELTGSNTQTMWGLKSKELPYQLPFTKTSVKTTVDQIIVVDMDSEDGAYRSWFPKAGLVKNTGESVGTDYLVALKVTIDNDVHGREGSFNIMMQLLGHNEFRRTVILKEYRHTTPIQHAPSIALEELEKVEGWILFSAPKEWVDSGLKDKDFDGLRLSENNGADIFLTERLLPDNQVNIGGIKK